MGQAAVKYREIKVLDEGSGPEGDGSGKEFKYNSAHPFWKHLPGERRALGITYASITIQGASQGGDDTAIKAFTPSLFYVSAGLTGPASHQRIAAGASARLRLASPRP